MTRYLVRLTALAALLALAPGARAAEVSADVRTVLADPRYRFCHEDDYPLTPEEHAWCPLVGEISGACPSLPKACKLPPVPLRPSLLGRAHRGTRAESAPVDRVPEEDGRQRPPERLNFSLPDMSGLAKVLFFVLLAVALVAVVRAIVKNLVRDRAGDPDDAPPDPGAGTVVAATTPRGPIETDVERLLSRARAAADRGDYARAVDDAYAALLRRLDGDGLIEIHPSRTNGDYVRTLRDRPDLRGPVGSIVRDVEGVQFGATAPSESVFRSVLERVIPLVSRALVLALTFLGLSVAFSCTPHDGDDAGASDASPSGTQAIVEVLNKHGLKVRHRGEAIAKLEHPLALVLLPGVVLDDAQWKILLAWVEDQGGRLVIAGVSKLPDEVEQRIVADTETTTVVSVAPSPLGTARPPGVAWAGQPALSWPPGSHLVPVETPLEAVEGTVLVRGELPVLTERTVGAGRIVLLADDRLLTNAALVVDDNASFLLTLLFRSSIPPEREVELCDEWTGAGAQTPLESVHNARLTPVVIQLMVLLALLFLWKGRAFARLRDPPVEARRSFADHARALGLAYGRSRASRHVTGLYAVWALERLRERVHRAGRQGLIPLAEAIAIRTGRPEGEVMSVLVDATGARDDAAPPSSFRGSNARPPIGGRDRTAPSKDAVEADLALMRALMSFLAATGQRRPTEPKDPVS